MAARNTPSKGGKPDKLMRDAIMVALNRESQNADGIMTKRLMLVADKLVALAEGGDMAAIKEVNERVDGKAPQSLALAGDEEGGPIIHKFIREIVEPKSAGS